MAALDFPSSPTNGQYYNGYIYNAANDTWDSAYAPRAATIPLAGRNVIVNGGFDIWQRGNTTAITAVSSYWPADRWNGKRASYLGSGATFNRLGNPGVAGLKDALRAQRNSGDTATNAIELYHSMEIVDSIPLQGETVTLSFYARAGANYSVAGSTLTAQVWTGTGTSTDRSLRDGFTNAAMAAAITPTLTTSWQRFQVTTTLSSTIDQVGLFFTSGSFVGTAGVADYYELTGVQLEVGPSATTFRRNAPSIQAELAACQRYYYRALALGPYSFLGCLIGATSVNTGFAVLQLPVTMRRAPISAEWSAGLRGMSANDTIQPVVTGIAINANLNNNTQAGLDISSAGGFTTTNIYYQLSANNAYGAYVGVSAEL